MNTATRSLFAPGAQALASAAGALLRVSQQRRNAEQALLQEMPRDIDRAAARAILAGSLRRYYRLLPIVQHLVPDSRKTNPVVQALLVTALHQLEYSRAAAPQVVHIAVDAARALSATKATGFINALLRRYLAEREQILLLIDHSESARLQHPRWLLREIRLAAGDQFEAVIAANNEAPPMCLRVNVQRTTRDAVLSQLQTAGIAAAPGGVPTSIVLAQAIDVERLPGFEAGELSVQDTGAQHAAMLLDAQPGERILDACAAPGGKTGHLLERTPDIELTAVELDPERLQRVSQNLLRLKLSARLFVGDLMNSGPWDDGLYDRVLLDAPCSGTGVIRRHPDIKLLRRPTDIEQFKMTQLGLLRRCATLVKPGGRLLYVTCSILPAENAGVVEAFLQEQPAWQRTAPDRLVLQAPLAAGPEAVTDGFHYACLSRDN